jgi:clan AA aspartic protease
MIKGIVVGREAAVEIELLSPARPVRVEAVIDTGYNGYLTLPANLVTDLGLAFAGYRSGTLADGSTVVLDVYLGQVNWHRQQKEILVAQAAGKPLIGMSLLEGNRLMIDVIEGGSVVIDELPPQ